MAARQKTAKRQFQPGIYRVTNTGRRNRVRDGRMIPGAKDGKSKGVPVDLHITDRAQLHRLRTTRSLEVEGPRRKPGRKPKEEQEIPPDEGQGETLDEQSGEE